MAVYYDPQGHVYDAVQTTAATTVGGVQVPAGYWIVTDSYGNRSPASPEAFASMFQPFAPTGSASPTTGTIQHAVELTPGGVTNMTGQANWVNVPNLAARTLNLNQAGTLIVRCLGAISAAAGVGVSGLILVRPVLDTIALGGIAAAGVTIPASGTAVISLAGLGKYSVGAGSHTVFLQWAGDAGLSVNTFWGGNSGLALEFEVVGNP